MRSDIKFTRVFLGILTFIQNIRPHVLTASNNFYALTKANPSVHNLSVRQNFISYRFPKQKTENIITIIPKVVKSEIGFFIGPHKHTYIHVRMCVLFLFTRMNVIDITP